LLRGTGAEPQPGRPHSFAMRRRRRER
jgi:hypothetical protein